ILEPATDCVDGLDQHPFLMPVRPDEFEQTGRFGFRGEYPEAMHPIREPFIRKRGAQDAVDVREFPLAEIFSKAVSNFSQFDRLAEPEPIRFVNGIVYGFVIIYSRRINHHTAFKE